MDSKVPNFQTEPNAFRIYINNLKPLHLSGQHLKKKIAELWVLISSQKWFPITIARDIKGVNPIMRSPS